MWAEWSPLESTSLAEATKVLLPAQFAILEQMLEHVDSTNSVVVTVRSLKSQFESIDNDNSSVPSMPVKVSSVQIPFTLVV